MTGTLPPNYGGLPQDPPAIVEQDALGRIQEGLNGIHEVEGIGYEIGRQINDYPAQGTNQPK